MFDLEAERHKILNSLVKHGKTSSESMLLRVVSRFIMTWSSYVFIFYNQDSLQGKQGVSCLFLALEYQTTAPTEIVCPSPTCPRLLMC